MSADRTALQATRFYTPDKLGPMCAADCGWPIPLVLSNGGMTTHPTCGPARRDPNFRAPRRKPVRRTG